MQLGNELLKSDMLVNEGAFQISKLAGRTMAGPVILKMKSTFSKSFWWKMVSFVHAI